MPRYIIKLERSGVEYYMEWSTVVDAPVSEALPLDQFKSWYFACYSPSESKDLEERLCRVEATGTSAISTGYESETAQDFILYNRAGENETCLTSDEIIDRYSPKE